MSMSREVGVVYIAGYRVSWFATNHMDDLWTQRWKWDPPNSRFLAGNSAIGGWGRVQIHPDGGLNEAKHSQLGLAGVGMGRYL
jgi:hypothetical protein